MNSEPALYHSNNPLLRAQGKKNGFGKGLRDLALTSFNEK